MYTVIVNPNSGMGAGLARLPEIEALLKQRSLPYRIVQTKSPEHATQIARECVQESARGVIAIGGDGTLFQIINGMAQSDVPLLFVPCGTGNDFIKSLKLPRDPVEALKLQLDAPQSRIDVGRMNDIFFLNVSGTGFDVDVLRLADKYKDKYGGIKPYLLALREAIREYRPTTAYVSIDGRPEEKTSFAIISIGNGRFIGGGMNAVPYADVGDGLFDVVVVKPVRKWAILPLIFFYVAGKHISLRLASVQRCRKIRLRCEGMTLNLDGELRDADTACFELLSAALAVQIPRK